MSKIKVLMVDDEAQFRATTSKILTKRGYDTTVAASGEEAVEVLKKRPQDVVVLDIKMPGMDGHEALARIKEINPETQVIMLTGHGATDSAKESLKKGAFDYLSKPCDIDLLATRINDAYSAVHKPPKEEKRARDIMIPLEDYTTLDPEATIQDAILKLKRSFEELLTTSRLMTSGHRSLLVLDKRGELIGILSIMDLLAALRPSYLSAPKPSLADSMQYSHMFWSGLFTSQVKQLAKKRIGEIMSPPPPAIDEDTNLMEITDLLYTEQSRRLVVTRQGKVVGVVREQEVFFEVARTIAEM
ncbi:MAG: response regulator [Deltaproteobacteria bacterium]|nr:response regulator [Deltaproteobacteria bacterium]